MGGEVIKNNEGSYESSLNNLKEIDATKVQMTKTLKALNLNTENSFYIIDKENNKVSYNIGAVKQYLENIKDEKVVDIKNADQSRVWIMAVQIALETMRYDVGKIDGVLKTKSGVLSNTEKAIRAFQTDNGLTPVDGIPGKDTIKKILERLDPELVETVTIIREGKYVGYIHKLTPELAIDLIKAKKDESYLDLDGLTTLDEATARELAKFEGQLWLNGLTTLDEATARELAKHVGGLCLNGLTTIDEATAKELRKHVGKLELNGLTTLDEATAREYEGDNGEYTQLELNGLTTLDEATARELGKHKGFLYLDGLTTLDEATAKELAQNQMILSLDGLTTLDEATAKELGNFEGNIISLGGLTSIDEKVARGLINCKKYIHLDGLTAIDEATARELANNKKEEGGIRLGLTTIDEATARELAKCKCQIELWNLETIDEATARELSNHNTFLRLPKKIEGQIPDDIKNKFFFGY